MLTVTDSKDGKSYEVVDYRKPNGGDMFLSYNLRARMCTVDNGSEPRPILKPIKWRAEVDELYYAVHSDARGTYIVTS